MDFRRLIVLLLLAAPVQLAAQQQPTPNSAFAAPADSTTHQRFTSTGSRSAFTVTAGTLPLIDSKGAQQASVFYVAYLRDDAASASRPVTFVVNGGPGASSAYLHLGALGPRILSFGADGSLPASPAHLVDNPDSWLDLTDLVFLDPVGTGYSRPTSTADDAGRRFWGVREDLESLAAFINLYLSRNNRMASPKYIVGESYGGFRAAQLPQLLDDERGISISGIFLISPVIEFSLQAGGEFNPLTDVLRLPSFAAVNLERSKQLSPAMLANAERFALGPYLTALAGTPHDRAALGPIISEVARLTGLPESVVAQHDGRVPVAVFTKEIRRADKLLVSRYDGSFAGPDPYPEAGGTRSDPLYDGLRAALTAGMSEYAVNGLGLHTDLPYRVSNGRIARQWNWRSGLSGDTGYAGAADSLRESLASNPRFKVIIAHGMTDLVTPYLASRFVVDHLPPSLVASRVTLDLFSGGHMMYLRADSRSRLHADAAKLYPAPPL